MVLPWVPCGYQSRAWRAIEFRSFIYLFFVCPLTVFLIVSFVGLEQFLWDYRCESRPVDVLLALGGNDLLRSGVAGVSLGLDGWKQAVALYSQGHGHSVPSTVLVCTLPWCVYFSFFLRSHCFCSAPRLQRVFPSSSLQEVNALIRYVGENLVFTLLAFFRVFNCAADVPDLEAHTWSCGADVFRESRDWLKLHLSTRPC